MKIVKIFTDGACIGNPGAGGYGVVLIYHGNRKEVKKAFRLTTNNRMELLSVIDALKLLKEPCCVYVTSDSKYVVNAINQGWLKSWAGQGWVKSDRKPVLNRDLWEQLLPLLNHHKVHFSWVKGHASNEENNRCDAMANEAVREGKFDVDEVYEREKQ